MKRIACWAGLGLIALFTAASAGWGALAVSYSDLPAGALRNVLATICALAGVLTVIALCMRRLRWRALAAYVLAFAVLVAWWRSIEPSNDRDWQTDVARLPYAEIDGDFVTVRNIRNFTYRTETDYTPAYYDKRFDVRKLEAVDLIAVYWMGPAVAHVFVSFAFEGGDHLAVSIETRKEKGESYSTVKGFFRQYELFYVVADERDVVRLRTNYRRDPPDDVYLYRLNAPIENGRRLFLDYIAKVNSLRTKPEFYNTLTTNCTTNIWSHSLVNKEHVHFSWKILASGFVPEYLYEAGRLDAGLPFDELRKRAYINARAQAADPAADFSRAIRAHDAGARGGSTQPGK